MDRELRGKFSKDAKSPGDSLERERRRYQCASSSLRASSSLPSALRGWLREPRVALACEAAAGAFLELEKKKTNRRKEPQKSVASALCRVPRPRSLALLRPVSVSPPRLGLCVLFCEPLSFSGPPSLALPDRLPVRAPSTFLARMRVPGAGVRPPFQWDTQPHAQPWPRLAPIPAAAPLPPSAASSPPPPRSPRPLGANSIQPGLLSQCVRLARAGLPAE